MSSSYGEIKIIRRRIVPASAIFSGLSPQGLFTFSRLKDMTRQTVIWLQQCNHRSNKLLFWETPQILLFLLRMKSFESDYYEYRLRSCSEFIFFIKLYRGSGSWGGSYTLPALQQMLSASSFHLKALHHRHLLLMEPKNTILLFSYSVLISSHRFSVHVNVSLLIPHLSFSMNLRMSLPVPNHSFSINFRVSFPVPSHCFSIYIGILFLILGRSSMVNCWAFS